MTKLAEVRKVLAASLAAAGALVANGFLHGDALRWTDAGILVGGVIATYLIPNSKLPS